MGAGGGTPACVHPCVCVVIVEVSLPLLVPEASTLLLGQLSWLCMATLPSWGAHAPPPKCSPWARATPGHRAVPQSVGAERAVVIAFLSLCYKPVFFS